VAGLGAFATSGLLLAQGQDAGVQSQPVPIQESQILAAHGLAMAIEGSTLEALAMQRGGATAVRPVAAAPVEIAPDAVTPVAVKPDAVVEPVPVAPGRVAPVVVAPGTVSPTTVPPGAVAPATVAEFAVEPGTVAPAGDAPGAPVAVKPGAVAPVAVKPGAVAPVAVKPVAPVAGAPAAVAPAAVKPAGGTIATGPGSGVVSHEPYGSDAGPGGNTRTRPRTAVATDAGTPNAVVPAEVSRAAVDPSVMELHRHATRAFEASDRLIKEAAKAGTEKRTARFQAAAARYAATLRELSDQHDRITTTPILVLNHGVKEALDALELRRMVRTMASPDTPAARALLSQASELETESLQTVERVLSAGKAGASADANALGIKEAAAGQGIPLQTIAMQASDVVLAIQDLTRERPPADNEK